VWADTKRTASSCDEEAAESEGGEHTGIITFIEGKAKAEKWAQGY
jgi:hypothetical protein